MHCPSSSQGRNASLPCSCVGTSLRHQASTHQPLVCLEAPVCELPVVAEGDADVLQRVHDDAKGQVAPGEVVEAQLAAAQHSTGQAGVITQTLYVLSGA